MFFSKEKIEKFDTIRFNFLIVKKFDNHLEVTLNRPQKKNALSFEMINELAICTDYANLHDSVRAVVYKSNGEIFCSGLDLIDFKDKENLSVSSTKSMTGHLLGAAGAIEGIATVMALKENIVPPTINSKEIDEFAQGWDLTLGKAKEKELNYALSNTFGFGGHVATVLMKKFIN